MIDEPSTKDLPPKLFNERGVYGCIMLFWYSWLGGAIVTMTFNWPVRFSVISLYKPYCYKHILVVVHVIYIYWAYKGNIRTIACDWFWSPKMLDVYPKHTVDGLKVITFIKYDKVLRCECLS